MKIQIYILQGPAANRTFMVEKNSRFVIGREKTADCQINDELLSREHCEIVFDGSTVTVTDLGSTNGTYIDKRMLEHGKPVQLLENQEFVAGRISVFKFSFIKNSNPQNAKPSVQPNRSQAGSNFGDSVFQRRPAPPNLKPARNKIVGESGVFSHTAMGAIEDSRNALSEERPVPVLPEQPQKTTEYKGPRSFQNAPEDATTGSEDARGLSSIAGPGSYLPSSRDFSQKQNDLSDQHDDHAPPTNYSPGQNQFRDSDSSPQDSNLESNLTQEFDSEGSNCESDLQYIGSAPTSSNPFSSISSIALPGQVPAQPIVPIENSTPNSINGRVEFKLTQLANGLFVHAGQNVDDVATVLAILRQQFESLYCVHMSRSGIESATAAPVPFQQNSTDQESAGNFSSSIGQEIYDESDSSLDSSSQELTTDGKDTTENLQNKQLPKIGNPLFTWLPDPIKWENPILLKPDELTFDIEEIWQKDAVICLFGGSIEQMSDHCEDLIKTNIRTGKVGDSMFGFCWPTVLDSTLHAMGSDATSLIFGNSIKAFLLEDPQQQHGWSLISLEDLSHVLT